ncbi:MAG: hypothetical protein ACYSUI_06710 [Planctomycetota bacterium]|jgi:hypothetical protein
MNRDSRAGAVALGALMVMGLTLCGGCMPIDNGVLGTFVRDLLLNATAALLL